MADSERLYKAIEQFRRKADTNVEPEQDTNYAMYRHLHRVTSAVVEVLTTFADELSKAE